MIQQLQQVFHSIIKSLEVLYVLEDSKPCARILVFEGDINNVISFLNKNGLHTSVSNFKVVKQNAQSEFYSDKSVKILSNSSQKGHFFVYFSKNKETAEEAKKLEEQNSHLELGLALGYPRCCCDFFEKNFDGKNTDLTLKTLENSSGYEFPFHTNIAARHFDVSLLSHFPHDFECKSSIEIAKNNLKIITKNSKELATMLSGILQGIVIYTSLEGIFLLRKHQKINNEIIYGDVLTTTKSKLYYLLSSNKKLNIIDKNNFVVNNVNIKGEDYGAVIFI